MLVLGLNQTLDRTITLGELVPGTVMRSAEVVLSGGGKAVNVARSALVLSHSAKLLGPFPGSLGAFVADLLTTEGLRLEILDAVDGEIRGTTIVLEVGGRASVINEAGPPLRNGAFSIVLEKLTAELDQFRDAGWLVVSGSAPPCTPDDAMRLIGECSRTRGWRVAVDAAADLLRHAVDFGADLVSPNLHEASALLWGDTGEAVEPDGDDVKALAINAATALQSRGAQRVLVSAGQHGVAGADDLSAWFIAAPEVVVANPIGAGDSLLGATVVQMERGKSFREAAEFGVAYASASVAHRTGGYADLALVDELFSEMRSGIAPSQSAAGTGLRVEARASVVPT